ncbi:unnamed protein product [Adineta steineri]|uniref:Endonuclease/exonuclease/phosphatase domain-containing protein n=1 Tax=Adineta steineri TaxID=433720 RepID=A0A814KQY7_9BILA|nr:unnamed protein product [Adineta steineri]CAF1218498.1 unnamed protein product [Adineta steineri]
MSIRVVTYNLLVPKLAEQPGFYMKSRPEFLRIEYRWPIIKSQLKQEIQYHQNTIICLQEVSRTLLPTLKAFFHRMNYIMIESLFGERYNDNMGVAIAVPVTMPLFYKNSIIVGDHIRSIIPSFKKDLSSLSTWRNALMYSVMDQSKPSSNGLWERAMSLNNTLVCVGVHIHGRPLFIGTYHMPCLFQIPEIMVMHSSAVKDLMFQLAAGHPLILAGDFNLQPHDISYRAITERGYARHIELPPVGNYTKNYPFNTRQLLRSAYREKNGTEPNYTNFSSTRKTKNFCATLDYIFFSGNLIVNDVLQLPNYPTGESYPDRTHPSDHLMLAASFQLF